MLREARVTGAGRRRLLEGSPWVWADQIVRAEAEAGDLVRVLGPGGDDLGVASFSPASRIALRSFAGPGAEFRDEEEAVRDRLRAACLRRDGLVDASDAQRLVFGESDALPGLIVDRYADVGVVCSLTPYWERRREWVVRWLIEETPVRTVIRRDDAAVRRLEGLEREKGVLAGEWEDGRLVTVREGGLTFSIDPLGGQKTGFFLDQRANRLEFARRVPTGARVLDAFGYQGAFGLHGAAKAGSVLVVDDSPSALDRGRADAIRAGFENVRFERANVFPWLRDAAKRGERFDVVVLDPPAFARNAREVEGAERGYRELHVRALQVLRDGGELWTATCSHHVDGERLLDSLRKAALDVGAFVTVVGRLGADRDHPERVGHRPSRYLHVLASRKEGTVLGARARRVLRREKIEPKG